MTERFVEQVDIRRSHQHPAERNTLSLSVGQLTGEALEQMVDAQCGGDLIDALLAFGVGVLARPSRLQRRFEVLRHRLLWIQRVTLERHRHVPAVGLHQCHVDTADMHRTGIDVDQTGNRLEGGGLTRTTGSEDDEELAVRDVEGQVLDADRLAVVLAEVVEPESAHAFTAPNERPRTR